MQIAETPPLKKKKKTYTTREPQTEKVKKKKYIARTRLNQSVTLHNTTR